MLNDTDEELYTHIKRLEEDNQRLQDRIDNNLKLINFYRGHCTHSETEQYRINDRFGYDEIEYTCKTCGKVWKKSI